MLRLQQLDGLPDGLLKIHPQNLYQLLPQPTLIHLQGNQPEPLFITVLMHGNEPTGFYAVQKLVQKYQHKALPRSLSLFFANIEAARHNVRQLENQPDFNRVWPGTQLPPCAESRLMQQVVDKMQGLHPFASIDIHNNTGLNPHYGCINKLDNRYIQLAALFARLTVYFTHPKGVQSGAMAEICPAITLECGRPDQAYGTQHVLDYLDTCLHLPELSNKAVSIKDVDLFHTIAQVKIQPETNFSFHIDKSDLLLDHDLEQMNFTEVNSGTRFGRVNVNGQLPVIAINPEGQDVSEKFFHLEQQELRISRPAMPSMLTLDEKVIRQDCLCYLMERMQA